MPLDRNKKKRTQIRWNNALELYESAIEECEAWLTTGRPATPSPRAPLVIGAGGGLSDFGIPLGGGANVVGGGKPLSRPSSGRMLAAEASLGDAPSRPNSMNRPTVRRERGGGGRRHV